MAYILNEDGFRDRMHGRQPATIADSAPVVVDPALAEGAAPAGAAGAAGAPSVARTSLGRTSLGRTSAGARPNIGRNSVQVQPIHLGEPSFIGVRQKV